MSNLIRLFIHDSILKGDILLNKEQTHYIVNVMRKKENDCLKVFDGKNGEWLAKIKEIRKKEVLIGLEKKIREQIIENDIWLIFSPIKNTRIGYLIEKATELGVTKFIPFLGVNSVVDKINIERFKAITIEAAEQSERLSIPEFEELKRVKEVLKEIPKNRKVILCAESGSAKPIAEVLNNLPKEDAYAIMVGPEGGFNNLELEYLASLSNIIQVQLGPRILRAETAVVSALSCYQAIIGDGFLPPRYNG